MEKAYQGRGGWGGHGPPTFLHTKKKKGRQRQKRKGFKVETIKRLSLRSKYYCFSHSRASAIRKFFLSTTGQLWWLTVLFSVPPPHKKKTTKKNNKNDKEKQIPMNCNC